jgi:hypothetical protein
MFEMREIKCKECKSIIGYSDADYAPLILCKDCAPPKDLTFEYMKD